MKKYLQTHLLLLALAFSARYEPIGFGQQLDLEPVQWAVQEVTAEVTAVICRPLAWALRRQTSAHPQILEEDRHHC